MAKNKLEDLRDHLFAQLERLGDEDLTTEQLEKEVQRAKSISQVSAAIIDTAKIEVEFLETVGSFKTQSQFFKDVIDQKQIPG